MGLPLDLSLKAFCLLLVLRLLAYVWSFVHQQIFAHLHGCSPPPKLPQKRFLFGLDFLLDLRRLSRAHTYLAASRQRFLDVGNTYTCVLGGASMIQTCDPRNVQAVLSESFSDFDSGYQRLAAALPLLGNGIFLSDGSYWRHSRTLLRPVFAKSRVDLRRFDRHIENLVRKTKELGSSGEVELQELFFKLSLDSSTEFLLGESTGCLLGMTEEAAAFAEAFDYAQKEIMTRMRMGGLMWTHRDPKFAAACEACRNFAKKYVKLALRGNNEKKETISVLEELAQKTYDQDELTNQLMHLLLAGRDTTASLLASTFFVLARRPDVWAKLRSEVIAYGPGQPSYEQLKEVKFISYILKEVLRLYPVVASNSRVANKHTMLPVGGGHDGSSPVFVRRGTIVAYSYTAMHRRKDLFGADAEEFRPERWETIRPKWGFLPFGGGPRICIGQQHAFTEVSYTLYRMAQEFEEITSCDSRPWTEQLSIVCSVANGVRVRVQPTEKSVMSMDGSYHVLVQP